ncbi:MAG: VOC family protein [Puniceicoccales bacterium]|jgi:predicted enzyme related to lactoylglutathione lyase|nr:VOC family protein [Puniceicoccales bacterium]
MSIHAKEIAFVGYPVTDVPRARNFYGKILGLKETMAEDFGNGQWWAEYDVGAGTIAISNAWQPSGQNGPSAALEVEDLDAALAHLQANGVNICLPTIDTPVCRFFVITDPDGNSLTIHQHK